MSAGAGRLLVVTGASRGIGAAIALRAGALGHAVAVNYRNDEAEAARVVERIRAAGGSAEAIRADVSDPVQVVELFDRAQGAFGPLHGLVANAGITGLKGRFADATPETIRRVIDVNLTGCMLCGREAVRRMSPERGGQGGVIVNISSVAAVTGSANEYVHYAASKAGVDAFTLGLAKEVAALGIRVNAVSPGSTLTGIHAAMGDPDRPARIAPRIPMGRLATPEEVAAAAIWMLGEEASYVTGSVLRVAGGL